MARQRLSSTVISRDPNFAPISQHKSRSLFANRALRLFFPFCKIVVLKTTDTVHKTNKSKKDFFSRLRLALSSNQLKMNAITVVECGKATPFLIDDFQTGECTVAALKDRIRERAGIPTQLQRLYLVLARDGSSGEQPKQRELKEEDEKLPAGASEVHVFAELNGAGGAGVSCPCFGVVSKAFTCCQPLCAFSSATGATLPFLLCRVAVAAKSSKISDITCLPVVSHPPYTVAVFSARDALPCGAPRNGAKRQQRR
jgi:hypothetical protein